MNTQPWSATIDINADVAAKLIHAQFPVINLNNICYLGEGWDNKVFLVNDEYVFRFPRRAEGVTLMAHEIRVMPFLAKHIHLPIAHPRFIGQPCDSFPYPFAGYDYLQGDAIADLDYAVLPETNVLPQLAHFLRELHAIDVNTIPTDITEEIARMEYEPRVPMIIDALTQIEEAGHLVNAQGLMRLVAGTKSSFPAEISCIVHGDFHQRHILIKDKKISGIIDWGDMSLGCKAIDLAIIYSLYPRQYHDQFWAIYGDVPVAIKQQAIFRAIYSNALLATYAIDKGYPVLLHSCLQGFKHCLEGCE